jgi:hypothetical protein
VDRSERNFTCAVGVCAAQHHGCSERVQPNRRHRHDLLRSGRSFLHHWRALIHARNYNRRDRAAGGSRNAGREFHRANPGCRHTLAARRQQRRIRNARGARGESLGLRP